MIHYDIRIILKANIFFIYFSGMRVRINKKGKKRLLNLLEIKTTAFQFWIKQFKQKQSTEIFIILLKDINKVLNMKKKVDFRQYFSKFYQNKGYLNLFIKAESGGLSSF